MENYSVRFSVDKTYHQIYLYFNFEGGRLKYYTGLRIHPDKWDHSEQRVKKNNVNDAGQTSSYINSELKKIHYTITEIYERHFVLKYKINLTELKNELKSELNKGANQTKNDLFARFEQYINDAKVSEGRRKHLKVTRNHFKKFLNDKRTRFEEVTPGTLKEFENYLRTDEVPKGDNTVSCNLKRLRNFFSYSIKEKWTKNDPFINFNMTQEKYGEPVYLTKEERDLLYDFDFSYNKTYEKVRDIFLFQCLIGARVGDMIKLTWDNIANNELTYIQNKTKEENKNTVSIPLTTKAKNILSRYNLPDNKLLPFITDQRYNTNLKEVFKEAGLNRKITRLNPTTGIQEVVMLSEIASSHMARRTFIGIMYNNNIKNDVIGSMSGHAKGSKAFSRYYTVSTRQKQEAINGID